MNYMKLFGLGIKYVITIVFHQNTSEQLLGIWVKFWCKIAFYIPSTKFFLFTVRAGMKLHRIYNAYTTSWIMYYLRRDNGWPTTDRIMFKNPLCPDGARRLYRSIIFNQDPKDLQATLNIMPWTKKLTECYKQRQARCGFASLI
jgi:hypothetical protein